MKKPFYETPEFYAIQKEWDGILKEEGFRDAELRRDPTRMNGMSVGDLARGLYQPDAEDYYRWARQHTHTLPPGPQRHVWRLHADGLGNAPIHRAIGDRYGISKGYVDRTIVDQKAAMVERHAEEFEEPEEYTVKTLIAEAVRPPWYTVPAKGAVTGKGLATRIKKRDRK